MLNADQSFIEPTTRDARVVAKWLDANEARGFFTQGAMVVFHGYGNTHDSMRRFFNLRWVDDCFIIQRDGNVSFEWGDNVPLEQTPMTPAQVAFLKAVARLRGNPDPRAIPFE